MNSVELKQERAGLVHHLRALSNRVEGENRDLNTEEKSEYTRLNEAISSLEARILRMEDLEDKEDDLVESEKSKRGFNDDEEDEEDKEDDRKRSGRGMWEERARKPENRNKYWARLFPELRTGKFARPEFRDIVLGTNSEGGYFATPVQLSKDFVVAVNNLSFVRPLANVEKLDQAQSLGVRQMTTQMTASWSGEITQVTPDTSTVLGLRELSPNLVSCLVTISLRTLQAASDVERIIMDRLQYQIAIKAEAGYITGNGTGQPLGLFTASASGIPTSQDVASSLALAKGFLADDVYKMLYNLPQQYRMSPKFAIFGHRSVAQYIRTLKDSTGQYLWSPGLQAGQPDVLAGHKFCVSEYAPSFNSASPTASQYVLCAGDMNYFHIADVASESSPQIVRLVERFADLNEIGLMARWWTDGSVVLPNAFSRLQLAAS